MSDKTLFSVTTDLRARLCVALPGVREADFAALEALIGSDALITDEGRAHPSFVAWIAIILARDSGDAGAMIPAPSPRPVPQAGFAAVMS